MAPRSPLIDLQSRKRSSAGEDMVKQLGWLHELQIFAEAVARGFQKAVRTFPHKRLEFRPISPMAHELARAPTVQELNGEIGFAADTAGRRRVSEILGIGIFRPSTSSARRLLDTAIRRPVCGDETQIEPLFDFR
jgi:hypothetical protein